MLSYCLRFGVGVVILLFAITSLRAQEAVPSRTPSEESASDATPTPSKKDTTSEKPDKTSSGKPAKSLEEQMRPEEFKAAGLDKLNEDELQHLDAYLQGYRQAAQKKAAEKANAQAQDEIKKANVKAEEAQKATEEAKKEAASSRTKLDSLVSRVDGTIEGIKGRTVIRLEDGSVWKQTNQDEHYKATVTNRPAAVVSHTWLGYKMQIEGMPEFYVDPVVHPQ